MKPPTPGELADELTYQRDLLDRLRARAEPVPCDFMGRRFVVHPRVFEPNLDTRALVEALPLFAYTRFLEVGGGTGVVSVFAAREGVTGVVVDLNAAAVANIRVNVALNGLDDRLDVLHSDLFAAVTGRFDLVIANLPFMRGEANDVVDRAIFDQELETWRRFLRDLPERLEPGGAALTVLPNFCAFADILAMAADAGFESERLGGLEDDWMVFATYALRPVGPRGPSVGP